MISATGTLCVAIFALIKFNPTDPNAGTNRKNAVSRDNLMNGADLEYSGNYYNNELQRVSTDGLWWSSTVNETRYAYDLGVNKDSNYILPQNFNNAKYYGRSVR